jgi:hypothetical protein
MRAALYAGYWSGLLLAVSAAGFLARLFLIQHDCGHGWFFCGRLANGRVIGVAVRIINGGFSANVGMRTSIICAVSFLLPASTGVKGSPEASLQRSNYGLLNLL